MVHVLVQSEHAPGRNASIPGHFSTTFQPWTSSSSCEGPGRGAPPERGPAAGETLDPERVYERFRELLGDIVRHDGLVVSSYDPRDDLIRCEYAWVEGNLVDPSTLPPLPLNREGGGMQSRVILSGEPFLFNDVAERVQEPGGSVLQRRPRGDRAEGSGGGPAGTTARDDGSGQARGPRRRGRAGHERCGHLLATTSSSSSRGSSRRWRPRSQRATAEGAERLEAAEAAALAVAAEREQAAQVLDAVGDGIFLVDGGGVVRLWNRAAERVTGLRPDACRRAAADVFAGWEALRGRIPSPRAAAPPAR